MSQDPKRGGHGSAIDLRNLRSDAKALSPEEFEDRHGSAFLLLTATELKAPSGPATTEVRLLDDDDARPGMSTAGLSLLAFPVVRSGRSVGHLVTIGRASNNDVAIPDLSISRFHAFLKIGTDGCWQILDAGSTNGSSVNGDYVPQQGHGSGVSLKAGDNLRLGQVELTFLGAQEMQAFAQKLER